MKILVVDDEESFGALLGRVLRKLGHQTKITCIPEDALELFRTGEFDAVITDIDMPGMSGVELARTLRAMHDELPIAFCTGSVLSDTVVREAERLGRVLPKVWTVADVRDVVRDLNQARTRLARGSQRRVSTPTSRPRPSTATPPIKRPRRQRRIKVTCRNWEQVAKLCDERDPDARLLNIRGNHGLAAGDRLLVALRLPDELVLSVAALVEAVEVAGEQTTSSIVLVGLSSDVCARLRAMCRSAGVAISDPPVRRRPRASEPPGSNPALRQQIDDLNKKLN